MNDVRVRPIRDKADGRINMYSVDVRRDGCFVQVAAFSSWDVAHSWAHQKALKLWGGRVHAAPSWRTNQRGMGVLDKMWATMEWDRRRTF